MKFENFYFLVAWLSTLAILMPEQIFSKLIYNSIDNKKRNINFVHVLAVKSFIFGSLSTFLCGLIC